MSARICSFPVTPLIAAETRAMGLMVDLAALCGLPVATLDTWVIATIKDTEWHTVRGADEATIQAVADDFKARLVRAYMRKTGGRGLAFNEVSDTAIALYRALHEFALERVRLEKGAVR